MTVTQRYLIAVTLALAGVIAQPCAAALADPGRGLAAACASCHRTDGHDTVIPPIGGMDESRIVHLMLAYRSTDKDSQIMHVVAAALTPEEIEAVAHYVAGHPSEPKQP